MGEHFNYLDDPSKRSQLRELLLYYFESISSTKEKDSDLFAAISGLKKDKWFRHLLATSNNRELESMASQLALAEYAKKPSSDAAYALAADSLDVDIAAVKDHATDEPKGKLDSKVQEFYLRKLLDLRSQAQEIAHATPADEDIN